MSIPQSEKNMRPGILSFVFLLFLITSRAFAHPVAQGAMEVVVHPDRVEVRARVSVEQAFVAEGFAKDAPAENTEAIWPRHGDYLLKHLFVDADRTRLAGRVVKITPPPAAFAKDARNVGSVHARPCMDVCQAAASDGWQAAHSAALVALAPRSTGAVPFGNSGLAAAVSASKAQARPGFTSRRA